MILIAWKQRDIGKRRVQHYVRGEPVPFSLHYERGRRPVLLAFSGGAGPGSRLLLCEGAGSIVQAPLHYAAVASTMILSVTLYLGAAYQPASLHFRS